MSDHSVSGTHPTAALSVANLVVGIAGTIVGIVGIYFSVVQSAAALNALGEFVVGTEIPPEFQGLAGRAQIFFLAFFAGISSLALLVGIAMILRICLILLGSRFPWHSALCTLMGLLFVGLSAALIGVSSFAVAFFLVQALYCFVIVLYLTSQEGVWDPRLRRLTLGSDLAQVLGSGVVVFAILGLIVGAFASANRAPVKSDMPKTTEPKPT